MIEVRVDEASRAYVEKRLGDMQQKAPVVISRALNKTATSARVRLARRAQQAYTVKTGGFNKDMQIDKANAGKLEATIRSHGQPLSINRFKYTAPKSGAKADITRSGLKALRGSKNIGAFRGIGGHIFQRKGRSRLPIKKLFSNSVPAMIGSERRVYGLEKENINRDLKKNIEAQINLMLAR